MPKTVKKKTKKKVSQKKPVRTAKKATKNIPKKTAKKQASIKTNKTVAKRKIQKISTEKKTLSKKEIKKLHPKRHPIESMYIALIILSLLGLFVVVYLIYLHYKPEAASICTINNKLDCDVVNKSVYARFLGIPNSIIGALGYLYFIISSFVILKGFNLSKVHYKLRTRHLVILTFIFALIGEGFSLYLLYIEAFVLHTYCIFCLSSLVIMTAIFILSMIILTYCNRCKDIMRRIHYKARGQMCRYC